MAGSNSSHTMSFPSRSFEHRSSIITIIAQANNARAMIPTMNSPMDLAMVMRPNRMVIVPPVIVF